MARRITNALVIGAVAIGLSLVGHPAMAGSCTDWPGDVNNSGMPDILDIQCVVLCSLTELTQPPGMSNDDTIWPPCMFGMWHTADLDCNDSINVTDTLLCIHWTLKLPISPLIDYNNNWCVDACETVCIGPDCPYRLDQGEFTGFGGTVQDGTKKITGHGGWIGGTTEDGKNTLEAGVEP